MEYRKRQPEKLSAPHRLGRWLRLKQYQIEVTFGVYMFTPVEKFVFWSVVFLLFGLFAIACILYLPQHIVFIVHRAWFYVNGGDVLGSSASSVMASSKDGLSLTVSGADAAKETLESIVRDL
ncbi:hypothetical protein UCREL1_11412 [Eutypa lata UCREL1]|uniref:Uncharacterized protein n=1 Tax=Eutypa lata (strain UCR-EL1) TaxID=1287681 RepID=M7SVS3_EUTLA|nr:hypothetical protein UCREL1_11412 [Eutypa lata UCREL1]